MAQRIYSLAKELNIDSKELVELCPKAGIQGKGSALASLTDEEVTKLRAYLDSASSRAAPAARMPAVQALKPVRTLPSAAARKARLVREEGEAVAVEDGSASRVMTAWVSGAFFDVLGARPILGRALGPADDVRGAENVIVLGHALWQGR